MDFSGDSRRLHCDGLRATSGSGATRDPGTTRDNGATSVSMAANGPWATSRTWIASGSGFTKRSGWPMACGRSGQYRDRYVSGELSIHDIDAAAERRHAVRARWPLPAHRAQHRRPYGHGLVAQDQVELCSKSNVRCAGRYKSNQSPKGQLPSMAGVDGAKAARGHGHVCVQRAEFGDNDRRAWVRNVYAREGAMIS